MSTSFVPIKHQDMNYLMRDMGFLSTTPAGGEVVYERAVTTTSGKHFPFTIRVYSSIRKDTGWSAPNGTDAIRVVLMDNLTGRPAKGSETRVHRTKNALPNTRKRCRSVFKYVLDNTCQSCGGLMVERVNHWSGDKFMACSRYAPGEPHHCDTTGPITTGEPNT